jgi:hypothetical protein
MYTNKKMEHDEERLLTVREVAIKLGLTPGAIHRARSAGRVLVEEVYVSTKGVRYRWSDINRVIRGEARFMRDRAEGPIDNDGEADEGAANE